MQQEEEAQQAEPGLRLSDFRSYNTGKEGFHFHPPCQQLEVNQMDGSYLTGLLGSWHIMKRLMLSKGKTETTEDRVGRPVQKREGAE